RLRLLDPNRFHDYNEFINEQQKYRPVADAVTILLSEDDLNNEQHNSISEMISEQDIEPLLKASNTQGEER
ncbi:hypothetical protein ACK4SH_38490, partial [Proteus mirabilis]